MPATLMFVRNQVRSNRKFSSRDVKVVLSDRLCQKLIVPTGAHCDGSIAKLHAHGALQTLIKHCYSFLFLGGFWLVCLVIAAARIGFGAYIEPSCKFECLDI